MKKQRTALALLCMLHLVLAFSKPAPVRPEKEKSVSNLPPVSLHAMYASRDFVFNTSSAIGTSHFNGHSDLYLVGANTLKLTETLFGGLFINKVDTSVTLTLSPFASSQQRIRSNSVFAHVLKRVKPHIFVDFMAGLGQNTLAYTRLFADNPRIPTIGYGNGHSTDWFTSIKGAYSRNWKNLLFTGNIGSLHCEVDQEPFAYLFFPGVPPINIPSSNTRASFLLESGELAYQLTPSIQPFVTGGLIQVLQFFNSHSSIGTSTIGSLPEINLNQNGYEAGIGLAWKHKQYLLRFEQQHYSRGGVYQSNQSIVSLKALLG